MLSKGVVFYNVYESFESKYNKVNKICVKRFREGIKQSIIFIDYETDGLIFSFTIKKNFSEKNINNFIKIHFKNYAKKTHLQKYQHNQRT